MVENIPVGDEIPYSELFDEWDVLPAVPGSSPALDPEPDRKEAPGTGNRTPTDPLVLEEIVEGLARGLHERRSSVDWPPPPASNISVYAGIPTELLGAVWVRWQELCLTRRLETKRQQRNQEIATKISRRLQS